MLTTKEQKKHLDDLHFEHQLWKSELKFYKEELVVFNKRLAEVVNKYTDQEVLAHLEHFQNQFIRQNEVADELLHHVKSHDSFLAKFAEEHINAMNHRSFDDHPKLRDKMEMFVKIYRELKGEYMRYLSKLM